MISFSSGRTIAFLLGFAGVGACSGEGEHNPPPPTLPTTSVASASSVAAGTGTSGQGGSGGGAGTASGGAGMGGAVGSGGAGGGVPTCTDLMKNGQETGVDCGGPICSKCAAGEGCAGDNDCESIVCVGSICQAPSCTDTVKNGDEPDVDCGGSCSNKCAPGQKCQFGTDCTTGSCNAICICPLGMTVATTMGGGSYCIDSGEVTYAQYDLFVLGNPPIQPAYCSWNTTYIPVQGWPYSPMAAQLPVAYVDWCDAYAYCKSVSKHLCGNIGGGSIAAADYKDHLKDGWYNACTAQNTNAFPYGPTYDPAKCNGDSSPGVTKPKQLTCLGGFSGLYDMSGNVKEWEDSCDAYSGDSDVCRVRGGSYSSPEAGLRCDADESFPRNSASPEIGIRCCI